MSRRRNRENRGSKHPNNARCDFGDLDFIELRLKPPGPLIAFLVSFQRGIPSPKRRAARYPKKLGRILKDVTDRLDVVRILGGDKLREQCFDFVLRPGTRLPDAKQHHRCDGNCQKSILRTMKFYLSALACGLRGFARGHIRPAGWLFVLLQRSMMTPVSPGASLLPYLYLDKANFFEVKTIVRVAFRKYGLHHASGHHDLTRFETRAP